MIFARGWCRGNSPVRGRFGFSGRRVSRRPDPATPPEADTPSLKAGAMVAFRGHGSPPDIAPDGARAPDAPSIAIAMAGLDPRGRGGGGCRRRTLG
ncbi:hypothetical protein BN140_2175 [Methanoculleus bourgensis MS2]|uniref:Uncharacterized protein n=1 Tax=Methanoculleus bourgensis (strain ATCC 43281 / DSM 3045 / OCM 15 / MS2) TaxID=1201294 RepID=I7JAE6_METBM|nr:hypothetical protein BN140_2175 [Methanoculleus bourgensis MS2]